MIGAPGDEASQSSYRSELTEVYCIILTVTKLCSFYSIDNGSIMVSCDNLLASEQAFGENDISLADPSYDLLLAIRCLLSISKVKWNTIHIEGHQDDTTPHKELDCWANLNINMDSIAKRYLPIVQCQWQHFIIPGEPWSLWFNDKQLSENLEDTLLFSPTTLRLT